MSSEERDEDDNAYERQQRQAQRKSLCMSSPRFSIVKEEAGEVICKKNE